MSSEGPDTITPSPITRRYSAQVRIRLHVNGQTYRVAQIGGGRLIFDSPVSFPATTGTVVMTIDGQEERWQVAIPPQPAASRIVNARITPT